MLTVSFPAAVFGTNCYVLAAAEGEECLIVDPGIGIEPQLSEVLQELRLKPSAVLLTHGHVDHVYSVTPVCGGQIGAYIHADDRYRLTDPLSSIGPQLVAALEQQFGTAATWTEPSDIREVRDDQVLELAGMRIGVHHAPGHTEGSVMFSLDGVPDGVPDETEVSSSLLSGDVLFAGSIGRTDLPGGDHQAMLTSLREQVLPLPDTTLVLPGHGPATTMSRERAANPYLQDL
ncbi:MBL fold metallo-hydrolase [Luteipulveratus mongoliensis]|uniref:Hydrolase n=1 Tax=Luteipulveratus mongoliensis TaxID=571913 RepID=A0A0K1JJZ3_9MICO|nr:MBL fold metallo-hydrolase [Luteipulveratus mongoliensis]AKU16903.1 hydrolase [Luteipulveratus mongoliensis]